MNCKTNKNVMVKEYEFNNPLIQKIDSIIDECIRDCHHKFFHTFEHVCEYDIQLTNITSNEMVNFTIAAKNMAGFV